jgi:hypothetical protein
MLKSPQIIGLLQIDKRWALLEHELPDDTTMSAAINSLFGYLFLAGPGSRGAEELRLVGWTSAAAWPAACKQRRRAWLPGNEFRFRFFGAWLQRA